jgi:hypothetical protein
VCVFYWFWLRGCYVGARGGGGGSGGDCFDTDDTCVLFVNSTLHYQMGYKLWCTDTNYNSCCVWAGRLCREALGKAAWDQFAVRWDSEQLCVFTSHRLQYAKGTFSRGRSHMNVPFKRRQHSVVLYHIVVVVSSWCCARCAVSHRNLCAGCLARKSL